MFNTLSQRIIDNGAGLIDRAKYGSFVQALYWYDEGKRTTDQFVYVTVTSELVYLNCVDFSFITGVSMYVTVTSELVRLNTENSHLQQEKQSFVETTEKLSEKAATLVRHA